MSDENTAIKDLTEMERMVVGMSVNFVFNVLNNQIYHIEHHDPALQDLLITSEAAQEDFILLQNCREVTQNIINIFGDSFKDTPKEELASLTNPALKLENFFHEIFNVVVCGD